MLVKNSENTLKNKTKDQIPECCDVMTLSVRLTETENISEV